MESQRCGESKHHVLCADHWDQLNCPEHPNATETQCEVKHMNQNGSYKATLSKLNLCDG